MSRILLIDDIRTFTVDKIARTYDEGIAAQEEKWDRLLLDHDLGDFLDGRERTGYDIMCWLEEHPEHLPKEIIPVTDNPVGRKKILQVIRKLY